jgi:hypothetical protein
VAGPDIWNPWGLSLRPKTLVSFLGKKTRIQEIKKERRLNCYFKILYIDQIFYKGENIQVLFLYVAVDFSL